VKMLRTGSCDNCCSEMPQISRAEASPLKLGSMRSVRLRHYWMSTFDQRYTPTSTSTICRERNRLRERSGDIKLSNKIERSSSTGRVSILRQSSDIQQPSYRKRRTHHQRMPRLSGLQRDVLSLYRQCLRAAGKKPKVPRESMSNTL